MTERAEQLQRIVVSSEQMRAVEARIFANGMPVAALMEKAGCRIADRFEALYPKSAVSHVGVLAGPGHNGGDALVVARELHLRGYAVAVCCPSALKTDAGALRPLTRGHLDYVKSLGIPCHTAFGQLPVCDVYVDGLFGYGLSRPLVGEIASLVEAVNCTQRPIVSIDVPSGLHSDSGLSLGVAIRATHTFCLGLWKRGVLQEAAAETVGTVTLIDIGVPVTEIAETKRQDPTALQRVTPTWALQYLPLRRSVTAHKYNVGHLLLVCGSQRYAGAAILAGLGARASGVGMLSIAVPQSLKNLLTAELPEALIIGCPESASGAIADFPPDIDLGVYQAIGCGCGLTREARAVVERVLASKRPIVIDADALNILSELRIANLSWREAATVLTPHPGEFNRLFPEIGLSGDRIRAAETAANTSGATVVLKGARVVIAAPDGQVRINPTSTPALARGGSGDVLTGLIGGLLAQSKTGAVTDTVQSAIWWHAEAGLLAATERTVLGVDARTLSQFLIPALERHVAGRVD